MGIAFCPGSEGMTTDCTDQRFYASSYGRFNTPDPYAASGGTKDPGSWNRYAYALGDPVQYADPKGTNVESCTIGSCDGGGGGCGIIYGLLDGDLGTETGCYNPCDELACFPETNVPVAPTCEQSETAFVSAYLSKRNSPLAGYASYIVAASDLSGIDDRFIVALAGVETTYGKTQQTSPTWGHYNAFNNSAHCAALSSTSDCGKADPYSSYGEAITDVISLLTGGKYFGSGLVTPGTINSTYNRTPTTDDLVTIYQQLDPKATTNFKVNFSRCP
jgi:RHS repeat-associated protein